MKIRLDPVKTPFNLMHTLECGQTFRWVKKGDTWLGVVQRRAVKIRQEKDVLQFQTYPDNVDSSFLESYFRLDDNLPEIYSKITKDKHVHEAIQRFLGLRLIRQEPWECLISYICATNKNIPAIKDMIFNLCKRFGKPLPWDGNDFFAFPEPPVLAEAAMEDLRLCKLGFRAEYVSKVAKMVNAGKFVVEDLRAMSYQKAKNKLMSLPGVGPKVADCVLLFSLDKLTAFPIDVWMKRIVLEHYSNHFEPRFLMKMRASGRLTTHGYETFSSFGRRYFGEYVGYAQEYLYHLARCRSLTG